MARAVCLLLLCVILRVVYWPLREVALEQLVWCSLAGFLSERVTPDRPCLLVALPPVCFASRPLPLLCFPTPAGVRNLLPQDHGAGARH